MKARNIVTRKVYEVDLTTDHAASSYGQQVMVINEGPEKGQAVDWAFYEIMGNKDIVQRPNKELLHQERLAEFFDTVWDMDGGSA
jgi:hypothetical protein